MALSVRFHDSPRPPFPCEVRAPAGNDAHTCPNRGRGGWGHKLTRPRSGLDHGTGRSLGPESVQATQVPQSRKSAVRQPGLHATRNNTNISTENIRTALPKQVRKGHCAARAARDPRQHERRRLVDLADHSSPKRGGVENPRQRKHTNGSSWSQVSSASRAEWAVSVAVKSRSLPPTAPSSCSKPKMCSHKAGHGPRAP